MTNEELDLQYRESLNNFRWIWGVDVSRTPLRSPEIVNEDVINQSIDAILGTNKGERLFNWNFGSAFGRLVFGSLTRANVENIMTSVVGSIRRWEDRIVFSDSDVKVRVIEDRSVIYVSFTYVINVSGETGRYERYVKGS